MNNEWEELKTMSAVAVAQAADMEIEVTNNNEEWTTWKGKGWHTDCKYRARPRKPAMKKYVIEIDGNSWCAYDDNSFINLQESDAAFGDTPQLALEALLIVEDKSTKQPAKVQTKSLCWRDPVDGDLCWRDEGPDKYKRFPAGDIPGEVET